MNKALLILATLFLATGAHADGFVQPVTNAGPAKIIRTQITWTTLSGVSKTAKFQIQGDKAFEIVGETRRTGHQGEIITLPTFKELDAQSSKLLAAIGTNGYRPNLFPAPIGSKLVVATIDSSGTTTKTFERTKRDWKPSTSISAQIKTEIPVFKSRTTTFATTPGTEVSKQDTVKTVKGVTTTVYPNNVHVVTGRETVVNKTTMVTRNVTPNRDVTTIKINGQKIYVDHTEQNRKFAKMPTEPSDEELNDGLLLGFLNGKTKPTNPAYQEVQVEADAAPADAVATTCDGILIVK